MAFTFPDCFQAHRGFAPHYDSHDTLIMQVEGVKQWHVCTKKVPGDPAKREKMEHIFKHENRGNLGCEVILLKPGDVLCGIFFFSFQASLLAFKSSFGSMLRLFDDVT